MFGPGQANTPKLQPLRHLQVSSLLGASQTQAHCAEQPLRQDEKPRICCHHAEG